MRRFEQNIREGFYSTEISKCAPLIRSHFVIVFQTPVVTMLYYATGRWALSEGLQVPANTTRECMGITSMGITSISASTTRECMGITGTGILSYLLAV